MKSKNQDPGLVLPVGKRIVEKTPPEIELDQDFVDGEAPKEKERVWYVVIIKADFGPPGEYRVPTFTNYWVWAYTRTYARQMASDAIKKGHKVIDIFPGTKRKMNTRFRGLK